MSVNSEVVLFTRRVLTEEALMLNRRRLRLTVEMMIDGVHTWERESHCLESYVEIRN